MDHFDRGHGVVVILHGHADEPADARAWARRMAPSGWEVVAPGAPRDESGTRSWFRSGPRGADAASLQSSAERVAELVDDLRGPAGRPVALIGFSQGAAVALAVGAGGAQPDAVVSICGFLAETGGPAPVRPEVRSGPRHPSTLLVAGSSDEVVPPFFSEDAAAALSASGAGATLRVVESGHELTEEIGELVHDWLRSVGAPPVRVSLGLPVDRVDAGSELVSGRAIADLAVAYERAGFHAAYVTDHPAPDERWLAAGGHHALEPTVALAVAAGATRRLALHTNVYVLAYRNPFLAAKALASLDVVSDGRLILGVAAGYLAGEFAALGVEHAERVELLERSLTELRRIWSGATVDVDGAPIRPEPLPVQRPTPPIWIGGNTVAAMRRAARHGDGWSPFPTAPGVARATGTARITDVDDLRAALGRCTEVWEAAGREETPTICFVPFGLQRYLDDATGRLDELVDEITELSALGVDWVALSVPGRTRAEVRDRAGELADRLGLRAEIGSA